MYVFCWNGNDLRGDMRILVYYSRLYDKNAHAPMLCRGAGCQELQELQERALHNKQWKKEYYRTSTILSNTEPCLAWQLWFVLPPCRNALLPLLKPGSSRPYLRSSWSPGEASGPPPTPASDGTFPGSWIEHDKKNNTIRGFWLLDPEILQPVSRLSTLFPVVIPTLHTEKNEAYDMFNSIV